MSTPNRPRSCTTAPRATTALALAALAALAVACGPVGMTEDPPDASDDAALAHDATPADASGDTVSTVVDTDAAPGEDAAALDAADPADGGDEAMDAAGSVDAAADAQRDGGVRDAWSGPSIDIDTLPGIHFGAAATDEQAANNVALINAAAERMRTVDGALLSTHGGVLMIGAPPGGSSGHLIQSGLDDGSKHGLNRWYLGNVTFRLMPHQPMFAEGTSPAAMVYVANATAPEFEFTLDGNAANQYQVDLTRTPGPRSHRAGFFGTGLDLYQCGPTRFALTVLNVRGVTGSTGPTAIRQPGHATTMVDCGEVFHMQQRRGTGGDSGWIHSETNDGSDPGSATTTDTRASGPVWHFIQQPHGPGSSPRSALVFTSINVRHGVGTYCGGRLQVLSGSVFDHCEHNMNFEAGIPLHADNDETFEVIVGEPGAPPGSVITRNASAIGIQCNNNSTARSSTFPYAHNVGIDHIDVYGWDSTRDNDAIEIAGDPNVSHFTVHSGVVHSPGSACTRFTSAADAQRFNLEGTCRVHLDGAALYAPAGVTIGSGSWDTSL